MLAATALLSALLPLHFLILASGTVNRPAQDGFDAATGSYLHRPHPMMVASGSSTVDVRIHQHWPHIVPHPTLPIVYNGDGVQYVGQPVCQVTSIVREGLLFTPVAVDRSAIRPYPHPLRAAIEYAQPPSESLTYGPGRSDCDTLLPPVLTDRRRQPGDKDEKPGSMRRPSMTLSNDDIDTDGVQHAPRHRHVTDSRFSGCSGLSGNGSAHTPGTDTASSCSLQPARFTTDAIANAQVVGSELAFRFGSLDPTNHSMNSGEHMDAAKPSITSSEDSREDRSGSWSPSLNDNLADGDSMANVVHSRVVATASKEYTVLDAAGCVDRETTTARMDTIEDSTPQQRDDIGSVDHFLSDDALDDPLSVESLSPLASIEDPAPVHSHSSNNGGRPACSFENESSSDAILHGSDGSTGIHSPSSSSSQQSPSVPNLSAAIASKTNDRSSPPTALPKARPHYRHQRRKRKQHRGQQNCDMNAIQPLATGDPRPQPSTSAEPDCDVDEANAAAALEALHIQQVVSAPLTVESFSNGLHHGASSVVGNPTDDVGQLNESGDVTNCSLALADNDVATCSASSSVTSTVMTCHTSHHNLSGTTYPGPANVSLSDAALHFEQSVTAPPVPLDALAVTGVETVSTNVQISSTGGESALTTPPPAQQIKTRSGTRSKKKKRKSNVNVQNQISGHAGRMDNGPACEHDIQAIGMHPDECRHQIHTTVPGSIPTSALSTAADDSVNGSNSVPNGFHPAVAMWEWFSKHRFGTPGYKVHELTRSRFSRAYMKRLFCVLFDLQRRIFQEPLSPSSARSVGLVNRDRPMLSEILPLFFSDNMLSTTKAIIAADEWAVRFQVSFENTWNELIDDMNALLYQIFAKVNTAHHFEKVVAVHYVKLIPILLKFLINVAFDAVQCIQVISEADLDIVSDITSQMHLCMASASCVILAKLSSRTSSKQGYAFLKPLTEHLGRLSLLSISQPVHSAVPAPKLELPDIFRFERNANKLFASLDLTSPESRNFVIGCKQSQGKISDGMLFNFVLDQLTVLKKDFVNIVIKHIYYMVSQIVSAAPDAVRALPAVISDLITRSAPCTYIFIQRSHIKYFLMVALAVCYVEDFQRNRQCISDSFNVDTSSEQATFERDNGVIGEQANPPISNRQGEVSSAPAPPDLMPPALGSNGFSEDLRAGLAQLSLKDPDGYDLGYQEMLTEDNELTLEYLLDVHHMQKCLIGTYERGNTPLTRKMDAVSDAVIKSLTPHIKATTCNMKTYLMENISGQLPDWMLEHARMHI